MKRNGRFRWMFFLLLVFALLWSLRTNILRGLGEFVITESELQQCEVVYVLGGSSLDRGIEAAHVLNRGEAERAVFLGEQTPSAFEALGMHRSEAWICRNAALNAGADSLQTELLEIGTSTMQEAIAVVEHATAHGYGRIMVLSNYFHLRRLRMVYADRCEDAGITLVLRGAASSDFHEDTWWQNEEGLMMLNNEYVKLLYYWWKY